ncbi:ATP-dependent DNA helicase PIF1 [Cyphomyrmex costatus]|uniref:ATP-dependent DNA helicase n=1 Tax=Cyphomyrmex costatus TaxID=456900 RepID=A0A151IAP0_9HYME|nr:ATP-dependent DNA helicase PIF1 [Cyphomyrmex costatus]
MPRRKIQRSFEEEKEFQQQRRKRKADNQRQRNEIIRNLNNPRPITIDVQGTIHDNRIINISDEINGEFSTNITTAYYQQAEYQSYYRSRKRNKPYLNINSTISIKDLTEYYIGSMDVLCIHCNAKHFAAEKISNKGNSFHDCCNHGAVYLESLPQSPQFLRCLFNNNHAKSNNFFQHIRTYNSSFSFASFNANLVNLSNRRPGPYCFKIQGQIYYQINTALYAAQNENPSYGQLFIIDSNEAINYRLIENSKLDLEIIQNLEHIMREFNIFAQSYQMMGEELENQRRLEVESGELLPELQLLFTLKPGIDRRRYNTQKTNEVAAVFRTTADGEIPESYVTIRNKNTKILQNVSTMDPNVEPWIYPLFYPYGTQGWHCNLTKLNSNKRITRGQYIKYRIAIRDEFNTFLRGRRLFQQWLVDSYVKIEKDRINYCKNHQKELRTETYQGLKDYMQTMAKNLNGRIGKMVILPSTFIGSPRNMLQNYQDSMAIVSKFGKPDLFITMTCNPKWREIEENLLHGQQASDRPDICARVFNIKKDYLIDLIVKQKFFGEVAAFVYVIEFQKRGLPHIHMLVTLKYNFKITTPQIVDKYISAEIPDPCESRILHDIVMKHMIHGPCGDWCLVNGKCSKHYPKSYLEETRMDKDAYPYYRRRNNGKSFERPGGYVVDNRYVVPYCPILSIIFNCHINVEVVSSIKSVKYLYKYIYKGHDAAAITIEPITDNVIIDHDEVRNFIETRYVGPVEACWRILEKKLQDKSHTIVRLPIHLPNEQSVIIENEAIEEAVTSALNQATMLIDYFSLNSRDEEAKQYLYVEIPRYYIFKKEKINGRNVSRWTKRKSHFNCIGRMYSVSPTQIELFHLRLLLLTVKGATSFNDLRTVNGEVYQSFSAACLALGLIEDDEEWKRAMTEAVGWMMPRQLRKLFVRILLHCQPLHPEELWENFKVAMSEDYIRHLGLLEGQRKAYTQINTILYAEGKSFADFPQMEQLIENNEESDYMTLEEDMEIGNRQYEQLNNKQKEIVNFILNKLDTNDHSNNCIYIDGPGGSGKTFIYTTIYHLVKIRNKRICTMAFTGIAATLLPEGKTVHKTFGLPVPLFIDSSSSIKIQSKEAHYLKEIDIFIWDEAPMAPRYALEIVDRTLRDIMNNDLPFGGKFIVLGGDFRQLLPIKVHGTRSEIINLSIKFSSVWKYFINCSLTENMRVLPEEIEFAKFLLNIGNGILNDSNDNIQLPDCCIVSINTDIVQDIYGDLIRNKEFDKIAKCAILSARNADVDEINKRVVELLDTFEEKIYTSIDSTENCDNNDEISKVLLPEYLNTLSPSAFPPHELRLKPNCVIMLIRNLSINEGLCNGTRLMIIELTNHLLKCKILSGDKVGDIVFLNRITLYCENVYPFIFKRRQFPIKLAFAMTINKSQGQTFDRIGIDLRKDVFNHGQLYVAFSRVRSWQALKIYLGNQRKNKQVKNYVYKEIL